MTKIAIVLFCVCYSCIAFAQVSHKDVESVLPEIATLEGQLISVHGLIDKLEKDGMSTATVIIILDGGLKCRISRDVFKSRKTSSRKGSGQTEQSFVFRNVGKNGLKIECRGNLIFNQGTDVVIRGTVKKEMNAWLLDRAVIMGCGDRNVCSALDIGGIQNPDMGRTQ